MALHTSLNSVDPRPTVRRLEATSNGLATFGANYSPNQQMGGEWQFPNAVRIAGGFATITSATIVDSASVIGAVDLYLFSQPVANAGDRVAANFSDADMAHYVGTISFPAPTSLVNNRAISLSAIGLTYQTAGTTLYGYLVTLTSHATFNAASDIRINLITYQY